MLLVGSVFGGRWFGHFIVPHFTETLRFEICLNYPSNNIFILCRILVVYVGPTLFTVGGTASRTHTLVVAFGKHACLRCALLRFARVAVRVALRLEFKELHADYVSPSNNFSLCRPTNLSILVNTRCAMCTLG